MKKDEIINSLEKIYLTSEDIHSVYTPLSLCEDMIKSLDSLKGNILIITNIEFLISLKRLGIEMNNVHYTTSCEHKKQIALNLGINLNYIHNLEYNNKELNLGIENMKFDVIIANPPYNQSLDLKFLRKSFELMSDKGEIIFVHPSTWLLDEKFTYKPFLTIRKESELFLDHVTIFNGNKEFNVGLSLPCVITHFRKNKKYKGIKVSDKLNDISLEYNDIMDINKYSNINEYFSIKEKINDIEKMESYRNKNKEGNFFVNISSIRGHVNDDRSINMMNASDFYTIITKDEKVENKIIKKEFFNFVTNAEAENFIKYLKTDFARFCLSIYKNGLSLHRGELKSIPYLDFKEEWTDEKIYKFFDISKEEIEFIEKNIPKYY